MGPVREGPENAPLRYLNGIRLDHALAIRKEGRLESLRAFRSKVWRGASTAGSFDDKNALLLAEELGQRIRDAEVEWKEIDTDLLKIVGTAAVSGLLAAGPLIAAGHGYFLAAAAGVAGAGAVANSTRRRLSFPDRFPAAFFMKIEKEE